MSDASHVVGLKTPPKQADPAPFSTPVSHTTSEGPLNGYKTTELSRGDLRKEFKTCTITLPNASGWLDRVLKFHNINDADAKKVLVDLEKLSGVYDAKNDVWTVFPDRRNKECDLYEPYKKLLQAILDSLKKTVLKNPRQVRISASKQQNHQESHRPSESSGEKQVSSRPDVLIVGEDPKFLPNSLDTPLPSEFLRAIVVGDIKRESAHDGEEEIISQVAMYAR